MTLKQILAAVSGAAQTAVSIAETGVAPANIAADVAEAVTFLVDEWETLSKGGQSNTAQKIGPQITALSNLAVQVLTTPPSTPSQPAS